MEAQAPCGPEQASIHGTDHHRRRFVDVGGQGRPVDEDVLTHLGDVDETIRGYGVDGDLQGCQHVEDEVTHP